MRILLINPSSDFLINEKVFPSLGLLYLSAYLKKHDYQDVSLIDMNDGKPLPNSVDVDIVGFYSNTPQFPAVIKLVREIKKINCAEDPIYVLGGPHVSGRPEDAMGEFDVAVTGEGERALLNIVRRKELLVKQDRIVRYSYMKDIDVLPFPDRGMIDVRSYKYFLEGRSATTAISSRGCSYGCKFCANNAWGKTLRMRSPRNVFEEIKMLKDKHGYGAFMFFDDTMTVSKKRMGEICELLKGLKIVYRCFIRSDTVDRNILEKMRESGCVEVGIGLESGSQRILDIVNKGTKVEKNMEIVKLCRDLDIRVKGFCMVGLPGENRESVRQTADFLEEADLDDLDVTIYTPYPGSLIYENKEKFDISFKDDYGHAWYKGRPGSYRSLVSTSSLTSAEILKIRDELEAKYKKKKISKT